MQTRFRKWIPGALVLIIFIAVVAILLGDMIIKQRQNNQASPVSETYLKLQDKTWYLERIGSSIVDSSIFIRFPSTTQIAGFDGCNSFSAPYTLDGKSLDITEPVTSTLVLCEEKANEGQGFVNALLDASELRFDGDILIITSTVLPELGFVNREITAGLVGDWDFISTTFNSEEKSTVAGSKVFLDFDQDGTFKGEACNLFSGNYTASAGSQGELAMNDMITTDRACLDSALQNQETEFYANINNVDRFQIFDNNILHIYFGEDNYLKFARRNMPTQQ